MITWSPQYFVLFDSPSEVFSLITPHHSVHFLSSRMDRSNFCHLVRRTLSDAPENIATLIRVVTSRLFNLISDHTFPSATNASVTAYASSFIKSASAAPERNTTKEVLNCLRILQRVLPVVFEAQGDSNTFESELLWKREAETEDGEPITRPQFVIEDEDESDHEGNKVEGTSTPTIPKPKTKWLPSLGERLLTSITDLLFCCGFTLPKTIQVDHHKINYVIWYVIEFKPFAWFVTSLTPKGKKALDRLQT